MPTVMAQTVLIQDNTTWTMHSICTGSVEIFKADFFISTERRQCKAVVEAGLCVVSLGESLNPENLTHKDICTLPNRTANVTGVVQNMNEYFFVFYSLPIGTLSFSAAHESSVVRL